MKKIEVESLFTFLLSIIILLLFFNLIVGKIVCNIYGINMAELSLDNQEKLTYIDWEKEYPHKETDYDGENMAMEHSDEDSFQKYLNIMDKMENIGESVVQVMYKYNSIAKIGYVINSFLTDPSSYSQYIELNNGYWIKRQEEIQPTEYCNNVKHIVELDEYMKDMDVPFMYIQTPQKICEKDTELPYGQYDFTNDNINNVMNVLYDSEVECLDLRKSLHNDNLNHYTLFYKTDHHWNVDAGLWATNIIENELNKKYDLSFDTSMVKSSKFEKCVYKNAMFGSLGTSVTHFCEESEDFSVLYPIYDTDFEVYIPDKELKLSGNFRDVMLDNDLVKRCVAQNGGYVYESLLYGNRPFVHIINHNSNGPKVLMIRDSFSLAVAPYMALSCSEIYLVDVRKTNGNFFGSVRTLINDIRPDVVLVLYCQPLDSSLK